MPCEMKNEVWLLILMVEAWEMEEFIGTLKKVVVMTVNGLGVEVRGECMDA